MLILRPGNPIWKAYIWYERLGGNRHQPESEPLGRFLAVIFLWLPLRWVFSWQDTVTRSHRIPPAALAVIASWVLVDGLFGVKLAILGVILWFLAEMDTFLSKKLAKKGDFEPKNDHYRVKIR